MDTTTPLRVLRPREAAAALGIGRSTLYQLISRGELCLVRLGPRAVGIRSDELERWIQARPVVEIRPPTNGGAR